MQSSGFTSQLSPQQQEALSAVVTGRPITEATAKSGMCRSTIHNWTRTNTIRARGAKALETIDALLSHPAPPANVRLRAAIYVLERVTPSDSGTNPQNEPKLTAANLNTIADAPSNIEKEMRETNPAEPHSWRKLLAARHAPATAASSANVVPAATPKASSIWPLRFEPTIFDILQMNMETIGPPQWSRQVRGTEKTLASLAPSRRCEVPCDVAGEVSREEPPFPNIC